MIKYFSSQPVLHNWCNKGLQHVLSCLGDGVYNRSLDATHEVAEQISSLIYLIIRNHMLGHYMTLNKMD